MGGYQAGYFTLSRENYLTELIVVGGRIKAEYFSGRTYPNLRVLVLHGRNDQSVDIREAKKSVEEVRRMGASVNFCSVDQGHRLTEPY